MLFQGTSKVMPIYSTSFTIVEGHVIIAQMPCTRLQLILRLFKDYLEVIQDEISIEDRLICLNGKSINQSLYLI